MSPRGSKERSGTRRAMFLAFVLSAAALAILAPARVRAQQGSAGTPQVVELQINDEVEPILAEYIEDGIDQAARTHASLVSDHDGHAGRAGRLDDGYHPAHSGFSSARCGLRLAIGGARGIGGIFHFAFSGCGGNGAGNACGRGLAGDGSLRARL